MWRVNGMPRVGFIAACVVAVLLLLFRGGWPLWTAGLAFGLTWIAVDAVAAWQWFRRHEQARIEERRPDEMPPP